METKIVTIDLDARSYDIYIGSGLLYRIADLAPQDLQGRAVFIIADENVEPYASAVKNALGGAGASEAHLHLIKSGEQSKSFAQVEKICHWLLLNNITRNALIIAVGGGVAGDLAGFCASVIMRGVSYIQIPTTLLAQVDSSVGGKTGINTKLGKNMVGSFYQPSLVVADIDVLKTLPRRELLAGYAEIAKYGLIGDSGFFSWLEKNGRAVLDIEPDAVSHAIEVSVKAKAAIVQADEKETGRRALLNFGHTFGHALEAAAEYDGRLLHGEAVAIGMCMAFDLSCRMGLCPIADYERLERHFQDIGMPTRASFIEPALKTNPDKLIEIMRRDKKALNDKMRFIVTNGIGQTYIIEDAPEDIVREVLKDSLGAPQSAGKGHWKSAFSSLSS